MRSQTVQIRGAVGVHDIRKGGVAFVILFFFISVNAAQQTLSHVPLRYVSLSLAQSIKSFASVFAL